MDQFFYPVNLDRLEFLYAWDYDAEMFLSTHTIDHSYMVDALLMAMAPGGLWHGNRLVWAGTMMDKGIFTDQVRGRPTKPRRLTDYCADYFRQQRPKRVALVELPWPEGILPGFIINHNTGQYVKISFHGGYIALGSPPKDFHPLPLLTSCGYGRGDASFVKDHPLIGSWAGHRLSTTYHLPIGPDELIPDFRS